MDKHFSPLIIELKRGSVTDEGRFSGYASTFGDPPDAVGDIIERGAFQPALKQHQTDGTMPAMLWHHDLSEPIGKWLHFTEDSHGLLATGQLTLGTRRGSEALALLKDDAVALSIGFSIAKDGAETKDGIRHIKSIARLYEVSLVSIPANSRARISKAKPCTVREFEAMLRRIGLSSREAKRAATGGWPAYARDERSTDDLLVKVDELKQLIQERSL
jgi:HK97 family phage prohead protease